MLNPRQINILRDLIDARLIQINDELDIASTPLIKLNILQQELRELSKIWLDLG